MALNESVVNGQAGHISDHAALKAEYVALGSSPAIADYTTATTPAQHAAIHNALATQHNALGAATTLRTNLTGGTGTTGHLTDHVALHRAYNLRHVSGLNVDLGFDTSEGQGPASMQTAQAHQKAWLSSPTRLGTGHSERFEIHNDAGDIVNGQAYRSMFDYVWTNDGGDSVSGATGYPDVYWCMSSFWPTQAVTPSQATVSTGFAQNQAPAYQMMFEIHERGNINGSTVGINNVNEVSLLSLMIRRTNSSDPATAQFQFRGCCGTWTWNGTGWDKPSWSTGTPSTTGKNDQIPIPIVKPGGTSSSMLMDAWLDVIFHVKFAKDSTGKIELWARQAGQAFTTSPNLSINGPTHKVVVGSDGVTRSSADYEPATGYTGSYAHMGLYSGGTTWDDTGNGANVVLFDETRRYGTLAEAKANWG